MIRRLGALWSRQEPAPIAKAEKKYQPTLDTSASLYYSHNTLMQTTPLYFQVNPSSGVPIYRQLMDQVHALLASGRLVQRVDELPLAEAAEAHRRLEAREVLGRIVLTV